MNRQIGMIGLGNMGKPMAMNLMKAGFELTIKCTERNKMITEELAALGAKCVATFKDITESCNVIISILPADKEIMQVYAASDGILESIRDGTVCIEMTSSRGDTIHQLVKIAASKGKKVAFIDAPVSGGVPAAAAGTLTIMTGGQKEIIDEYMPILSVLGKKIVYTGDVGSGKDVKMLNQILNAANTCIASEVMYIAEKKGLDTTLLWDVINNSSGASWVSKNNVPKYFLTKNHVPGFKLGL
ncbi:MAG: NAD(P)-dependent oxidoreductase, partial [Clostridia bacterium]